MPPPKLSVCIDVFNYARFLPEAIKSVLGQSFRDFELIILDDCSTDDSFQIAQEYAARDHRIRALRNASNLGMVKNRNACLRMASGEYVKFVHADDFLCAADALEKLTALLDSNPSVSLAASAMKFVDTGGHQTGVWSFFRGDRLVSGTTVIQQCLRNQRNLIGNSSAVIFRRMQAGRGFNEAYRHSDDIEMWFHLLEQGCFGFINEPLCAFRRHGAQQTEKLRGTMAGALENKALLDDYLNKPYVRFKPWFKRYLLDDARWKIREHMEKTDLAAGQVSEDSESRISISIKRTLVRQVRFFERHVVPRFQPRPRQRPFGINVAGFFTGEYGVGDSSRAYAQAVERTELPHVMVNIRSKVHSNRFSETGVFSTRNPYAVNLMTFAFDYARRFSRDMGRGFFRDRYNIALWFWELEKFPARWHSAFDYYDEIWTATDFSRIAFEEVSPVPVRKITYPLFPAEMQPDRGRFGISESTCVFLFNFDYCSLVKRKNPLALIRAFQLAFQADEDVVLVLKSINGDREPAERELIREAIGDAKIICIGEHLRADTMNSLFATCDCYVSMHRAEGFGIGMAQAMALGKPVIATGYSGNMEFMNPGNSLPVRYQLSEIEEVCGPYEPGGIWAEPDVGHAAELMQWVFTHRVEASQIGRQAATDIRRNLSPDKTKHEIMERLRGLNPAS